MRRGRMAGVWWALSLAMLVGCEAGAELDGDILAIGDSFLDYHTPDADIATVAGQALGLGVDMLAAGGTTMLDEYSIADSYVNEGHTLMIASGGGNDFAGCVCGESCDGVMDRLISTDGTEGAIPDLVYRALSDGRYVAWAGYMRPMPDAEEFASCTGELDVLRDRLQRLDDTEDNMIFVDGSQIGTGSEPGLYEPDGYHPSPEGCAAVGAEIARRVDEAFALSAEATEDSG